MVEPAPQVHLAQLNVGRLRAPVDSLIVAEFVEALDPVTAEPAADDERDACPA